ncbi:MAG: radical SAM protein [Candidatus Omnitrophota bacterium]
MKITLVQCPAFGIDRPPLALGYLAAFLREQGQAVRVFDFNADLYAHAEEAHKRFWEFSYVFQWMNQDYFSQQKVLSESHYAQWAEMLLRDDPDILGFSVQSSSLICSLKLAREIRKRATAPAIVFGGPLHLSYSIEHADHLLQMKDDVGRQLVDVVVLGEGEETLLDIARRLEAKESLRGCPGTVIRAEDGKILRNGPRSLIENLDILPFPDFHDFPSVYKYDRRWPILGSRGCVNRCVFCDDALMWRRYRYRSAANIFQEMKLRKEQGAEFLEFNDLLINGNSSELLKLCNLLIGGKLGLTWGGSACVGRNLDREMLKKLKQAGCCYLNFGIESASPKILKDMNKSFTISEVQRVITEAHRAGMDVCTNWIVGFPTEREEDFQQTLQFITRFFKLLRKNLMVNSFILKDASLLARHKEKFGVVAGDGWNWVSQDGANTVEVRKRRYDEFLATIERLGDKPKHKTFQGQQ